MKSSPDKCYHNIFDKCLTMDENNNNLEKYKEIKLIHSIRFLFFETLLNKVIQYLPFAIIIILILIKVIYHYSEKRREEKRREEKIIFVPGEGPK